MSLCQLHTRYMPGSSNFPPTTTDESALGGKTNGRHDRPFEEMLSSFRVVLRHGIENIAGERAELDVYEARSIISKKFTHNANIVKTHCILLRSQRWKKKLPPGSERTGAGGWGYIKHQRFKGESGVPVRGAVPPIWPAGPRPGDRRR